MVRGVLIQPPGRSRMYLPESQQPPAKARSKEALDQPLPCQCSHVLQSDGADLPPANLSCPGVYSAKQAFSLRTLSSYANSARERR